MPTATTVRPLEAKRSSKQTQRRIPGARRRWVTDATAAHSMVQPTRPRSRRGADPLHRLAILERARRRRMPWVAAALTYGWGLVGAGAAWLFATVSVPAGVVACVVAAVPVVAGLVSATLLWDYMNRWWADLSAATVFAAAITAWMTLAGPSVLNALVLLLATIVTAGRWWNAHPVGPGVPPLRHSARAEKEEKVGDSAPDSSEGPEAEVAIDEYVEAWDTYVACKGGVSEGSRLTGREETEYTITYLAELRRGAQTWQNLQAVAPVVAGGLGLPREKLLVEKPPRGYAEHVAKVTIITGDPVAEPRFYSGPLVEGGTIIGPARYADGIGVPKVKMWDNGGTIPTMVVGGTGGGKSACANILTCSAMSTGRMNLLYIDPKGNSSAALAKRARIALLGQDAALQAPALIDALIRARQAYSIEIGSDLLLPSESLPGWMVLHDEFSYISDVPQVRREHAKFVNIVRSLGLWYVALNQALHSTKWGDDHTRAAFAKQVIAFRINSKSDDLVPGLTYRPSDLPVDDEGQPVPGMAVHANIGRGNVPVRWDWLPTDSDVIDGAEPPYRTSSAFDAFFRSPDLHPIDQAAIESVLGPAVDGRWMVGPGGSHEFLADTQGEDKSAKNREVCSSPGFGFGPKSGGKKDSAEEGLSPVQREVLRIIRGGTEARGEIENAARASRSAVGNALDALRAKGLIHNPQRGIYRAR